MCHQDPLDTNSKLLSCLQKSPVSQTTSCPQEATHISSIQNSFPSSWGQLKKCNAFYPSQTWKHLSASAFVTSRTDNCPALYIMFFCKIIQVL